MTWILRMKHWQIFLIVLCTSAWSSPSPLKECINVIAPVFTVLWVHAIGIIGYRKILASNTKQLQLFKISSYGMFLIISYLYLSILFADDANMAMSVVVTVLIVLLIIMIIHNTIFAGKILARVKLGPTSKAVDYWPYVLGLIFSLVGVWFIQPIANRLAKEIKD